MRYLLFASLLVFATTALFAQSSHRRTCGVTEHLQHLSQENPQVYNMMEHANSIIRQHRELRRSGIRSLTQKVRVIPVVFHVVYKTEEENIPDEQIHSQIRILNEDFRRMVDTKGHNAHPDGADTMIEFRLAEVDPKGKPTTGINRTSTKKDAFEANDAIKSKKRGGQKAWDTSRYLNIWVGNLKDGLLGYAQFPGSGKAKTDGVVILYSSCGDTGNVKAPYNLGRTATHEVGHWLGLRHIWGDGGCTVDDGFEDTPRSDSPNFGMPTHPLLKCGSDDMFENYMDYTEDAAMNIFTRQQSEHMNSTLDTLRADLFGWQAFSKTE